MKERDIVKWNGHFWVVGFVKNGMAVIWRNGKSALIPVDKLVVYHESK